MQNVERNEETHVIDNLSRSPNSSSRHEVSVGFVFHIRLRLSIDLRLCLGDSDVAEDCADRGRRLSDGFGASSPVAVIASAIPAHGVISISAALAVKEIIWSAMQHGLKRNSSYLIMTVV